MTNKRVRYQESRKVIFVFLFTCFFLNSYAQLNESDTAKIQITASINGIRQKGNVDLRIIRSRLEFVMKFSDKIVFKSQNNTLYQAFNEYKADKDLNSRNYLYANPAHRIYPFAMAYVQSNFRLKIRQRLFYGAGATIQIIKKQNHSLKTSASLVYETTRYNQNEFNKSYFSGSNSISIFRPTLYVAGNHKLTNQKIRLQYSAFWQPGINKASNQRFQGEIGIDFNIWQGFNINIQHLVIYEEVVPVKVKQHDSILTFGLNYQIRK